MECAFNNNSDNPHHKGYDFLKEAKTFFGTLFSGLLKSNDTNIYKALLVGVLHVAKSGFLSDLNNLIVYPMFEKKYADKFGFTEAEVNEFIGCHPVEYSRDVIEKWYNSYSAGEWLLLYNPWSIVSLCTLKKLASYWVATGNTIRIKELIWRADINFQQQVDKLIKGEVIEIMINHDISYETLQDSAEESLWSLLYYSGYLTIGATDRTLDGEDVEMMGIDYGNNLYYVRIPNHEILMEWKEWFSTLLGSEMSISPLLALLLTGNGQKFSTELPIVLESSLNYYMVGGKRAESFYHAFFMGLFIHARDCHCEVRSEIPAGTGRFDFSLHPPQSSPFHAVISEFKIVGKNYGSTLEDAAITGLQQILDKNYRVGLPQYVTKLLELGVAFEGNLSHVVFRKLEKVNNVWNVISQV
jgi:hypothetical protein